MNVFYVIFQFNIGFICRWSRFLCANSQLLIQGGYIDT